jgi:hypothetical protein
VTCPESCGNPAVQRSGMTRMTLTGHKPDRNPAPQQAPDLMLANPLCLPLA